MGTGDRLLLISGSRHCTVVALDLILRKLIREGVAPAVEQKLSGGGDSARLSTGLLSSHSRLAAVVSFKQVLVAQLLCLLQSRVQILTGWYSPQ
jgi:hypothetical protein